MIQFLPLLFREKLSWGFPPDCIGHCASSTDYVETFLSVSMWYVLTRRTGVMLLIMGFLTKRKLTQELLNWCLYEEEQGPLSVPSCCYHCHLCFHGLVLPFSVCLDILLMCTL